MINRLRRLRSFCIFALLLLVFPVAPVAAQNAFSYQGKLSDNGNPANGNYDFTFSLWDAASGGTSVADIYLLLGVTVTNGSFTVALDFGAAAFPGANRYLEIAVRPANTGSYTTLTPRQQILSTPYAIKSAGATAADGLSVACVNCITSSQIQSVNGSAVTGIIPVASVPAGSSNYIQNSTTQQAVSNFNISGNGIVGGNLSVGNAGTSARLYMNRASAIAANSADINFYSAGSPDFALGTSLGSAAPSDFSIYNYGTGSNALTIQKANGFVGIGPTAPQQKLHLSDNNANATALLLENTTSAGPLFFLNYGSTGGGTFWPGLNSAGTSAILTTKPFVLGANGSLIFSGSNGGEHMRITSSGRVGIGTTMPNAKLQVVSGNDATGVLGVSINGDGLSGSSTNAVGVRGDSISHAGVLGVSTDYIGVYGTSTNGYGVYGSSPNYAGYFQGNVYVTGIVIQNSDARLKQNITTLGYGLSEVLRLHPVTWRWKAQPERGPQLGLVAQEVETVLPELVLTAKDNEQTKGLNYVGLVPVLVNAIQEQQQQLDQQQERISLQQAEIETLQHELRQAKQQKELIQQQQQEMTAIRQLLCASHPEATFCKAKSVK